MTEFVLFFRMNVTDDAQPTDEQMSLYMQQWTAWISEIAENGKLAEGGNHLSRHGRTLFPNKVMQDTPYVSENISVAGYILILADDIEEASRIASKCPILKGENTSVEIREVSNNQ